MFGWLPIIGPIIEGITGIFSKWQDTKLGMKRAETEVDLGAMRASVDIINATKDDIGVRLMRDLALTGPVIWSALIGWDTIVAMRWPWLKFMVADYPTNVQYIPYAALAFLFGNVGLIYWKRK